MMHKPLAVKIGLQRSLACYEHPDHSLLNTCAAAEVAHGQRLRAGGAGDRGRAGPDSGCDCRRGVLRQAEAGDLDSLLTRCCMISYICAGTVCSISSGDQAPANAARSRRVLLQRKQYITGNCNVPLQSLRLRWSLGEQHRTCALLPPPC